MFLCLFCQRHWRYHLGIKCVFVSILSEALEVPSRYKGVFVSILSEALEVPSRYKVCFCVYFVRGTGTI